MQVKQEECNDATHTEAVKYVSQCIEVFLRVAAHLEQFNASWRQHRCQSEHPVIMQVILGERQCAAQTKRVEHVHSVYQTYLHSVLLPQKLYEMYNGRLKNFVGRVNNRFEQLDILFRTEPMIDLKPHGLDLYLLLHAVLFVEIQR